MQCAGVVLCGGQSRRMGTDKAWLPFGDETMLQRVVRILNGVVRPVVVVAAASASLPDLPSDVRIVRDRRPERGPLEGLAAGFADLMADGAPAMPPIEAAYVTSCDVPLLLPAFVRRMIELLGSADVAVPEVDGRLHPLAAVYRRTVLVKIEQRLAKDQLRLTALVVDINARIVRPEELREIDPQLFSLRNVNDQAAYREALAISLRSSSPNRLLKKGTGTSW